MDILLNNLSCPWCGKKHKNDKKIKVEDWNNWQDGGLIQNCMPYLTPTEREQLISGLCPKCQEEVFA